MIYGIFHWPNFHHLTACDCGLRNFADCASHSDWGSGNSFNNTAGRTISSEVGRSSDPAEEFQRKGVSL
jgi:hypothetical protein